MYIPKSPFVLCIELTTQCNLDCPHCLADADSKGKSLPHEKVISIIDEAESIGVKELVFGGGEPILYDSFFEISEYALSKGLNLTFTTNGILVPKEIHRFSQLIKYNNLLQVGVSLDGPTSEIHGYFRPEESFESAIEAIKLLQEADIKVHVLCVLNKANTKVIPKFLNFLTELKISNVRLLPFMPIGRGKQYKEEMLSPGEFCSILQEKPKWSKIYGINIGLHIPWEFLFLSPEKRFPYPCEAGYLRLWINSQGDMFPCSYMSDLSIGNIYRDSISDTWLNSPILKKFRDPALLKGTCATCIYRDGCRGGCRGLAYFLEGDYLCSDPYCQIVNQKQNA
jgi:radical SAM protein with 4Fe4S-binding SPASM domain